MKFMIWNLDEAQTAEWLSSLDDQKTIYQKNDNIEVLQKLSIYDNYVRFQEIDNVQFPELEMVKLQPKETDIINVQNVYNAMSNLPLKYATSPNFWIGAAHSFGWKYIHYRISDGIFDDTTFKTHFFFENPNQSHVPFMHCLARLWWAGKLLYDDSEGTNDPWGLLRAIPNVNTAFASHILIIGSSNLTARKENVVGLMRALKKYQDKKIELRREHLVTALVYLNSIASTILLDYLSSEYIEKQILQCLKIKYPDFPMI